MTLTFKYFSADSHLEIDSKWWLPRVPAEYREQAVVVQGYFFPPHQPQTNPTVIDVLGPEYAPKTAAVHIDKEVISLDTFQEPDAIEREGELSKDEARGLA